MLSAEVTLLSQDPLLGIITLETDTGPIELVMNRIVAERVMAEFVEFLQHGKGDDSPTFAVERSH